MINREDYERELDIFVDDQIKLINKLHNQISENAKNFHRTRCFSKGTDREAACEEDFVKHFIMMLNQAQIETHFSTALSVVKPPQEDKGVGLYL